MGVAGLNDRWAARTGLMIAALATALLAASCKRGGGGSSSTSTGTRHDGTAPVVFVDIDIPVTTGAAAGYVPDHACAECHQALYRSFQNVAMARSLYRMTPEKRVEDFTTDNHFFNPDSNQHFQMQERDGQFFIKRYQLDEAGREINSLQQQIGWVVGSGTHVRSYIYRTDSGEMFELPVAWYSQRNQWGMAPGYHRADHQGFMRPIGRDCLSCHNAYPDVPAGSDVFGNRILFPKEIPQGIGCQRCHGPGGEHIRVANESGATPESIRSAIVNPARLEPRLRDDVCFQCHLEPTSKLTSIFRRIDRADYSFRPGQSLDDFDVYIDSDEPSRQAERFHINHHPYRLRQSTCYIASGGKLNCLTCHDPHVKLDPADAAAHYRDRCLSCHSEADCGLPRMQDPSSLPESFRDVPADNCVACHMPKRAPQDVVFVVMTDHRIQRQPLALEALPTSRENDRNPEVSREFYMPDRAPSGEEGAMYVAMAKLKDGKSDALPDLRRALAAVKPEAIMPWLYLGLIECREFQYSEAVATLTPIVNSHPDLAEAQLRLGVALREMGRVEEAETHLRAALALEPDWADAHLEMGFLMTRLNRLEEAVRFQNEAVQLRPNSPVLRLALGNALAAQEKFAEAVAAFEQALAADPNTINACLGMGLSLARLSRWDEAVRIWRRGAAIDPKHAAIAQELALIYLTPPVAWLANPAEGLVFARRAYENAADNPNSRAVLALANLMNSQFDEALTAATQAAGAGADEVSCKLIVAMARLKLGQADEARSAYQDAQAAASTPATDRIRPFLLRAAAVMFRSPGGAGQASGADGRQSN